jgi:hypothetical protein
MSSDDGFLITIGGIKRLENADYRLVRDLNAQCYCDSTGSEFLKTVKVKFEIGLRLRAISQTLAQNGTDYSAALAVRVIRQCKL